MFQIRGLLFLGGISLENFGRSRRSFDLGDCCIDENPRGIHRDVASRLRDGRGNGARISREDLDAVLARLEEMRDAGEITDIELARLKASARSHA